MVYMLTVHNSISEESKNIELDMSFVVVVSSEIQTVNDVIISVDKETDKGFKILGKKLLSVTEYFYKNPFQTYSGFLIPENHVFYCLRLKVSLPLNFPNNAKILLHVTLNRESPIIVGPFYASLGDKTGEICFLEKEVQNLKYVVNETCVACIELCDLIKYCMFIPIGLCNLKDKDEKELVHPLFNQLKCFVSIYDVKKFDPVVDLKKKVLHDTVDGEEFKNDVSAFFTKNIFRRTILEVLYKKLRVHKMRVITQYNRRHNNRAFDITDKEYFFSESFEERDNLPFEINIRPFEQDEFSESDELNTDKHNLQLAKLSQEHGLKTKSKENCQTKEEGDDKWIDKDKKRDKLFVSVDCLSILQREKESRELMRQKQKEFEKFQNINEEQSKDYENEIREERHRPLTWNDFFKWLHNKIDLDRTSGSYKQEKYKRKSSAKKENHSLCSTKKHGNQNRARKKCYKMNTDDCLHGQKKTKKSRDFLTRALGKPSTSVKESKPHKNKDNWATKTTVCFFIIFIILCIFITAHIIKYVFNVKTRFI